MRKMLLGWLVGAALAAMTGCGNFFVHPGSTTTTPGSTTGDFAYVVNSTLNTLSEYAIGTGTLAVVTGSPITLEANLAARSVVVTPGNGYVYVGGSGAIDCFSVASNGALTAVTTARVTAAATFVSLTASVDGKWLLALDGQSPLLPNLYVYGVNTSTGALSLIATNPVQLPNGSASAAASTVRISPSGSVVAVTLGAAGAVVYNFNDANGALTFGSSTFTAGYTDFGVAFDPNSSYLYLALTNLTAGTSGIKSFAVSSTGVLTNEQNIVASGSTPSPLVFSAGGTYLYAGNKGDSTVTGYTAANGVLTVLASSPNGSVPGVVALTRDNGNTYLVAVGSGGGNDVTLYALDALTAGKLDSIAVAATGSTGAVAVAATHPSSGL